MPDDAKMYYSISIHAPARGATVSSVAGCVVKYYFNPRSREGSDALLLALLYCFSISIHAPARGATITKCRNPTPERNFNPRSREGSDSSYQFPTCPGVNFNPRSREGSDCKNTQTTNIISVYFYLYYIIFVSLATNTAYITITKPSKCRCESPYTFC